MPNFGSISKIKYKNWILQYVFTPNGHTPY